VGVWVGRKGGGWGGAGGMLTDGQARCCTRACGSGGGERGEGGQWDPSLGAAGPPPSAYPNHHVPKPGSGFVALDSLAYVMYQRGRALLALGARPWARPALSRAGAGTVRPAALRPCMLSGRPLRRPVRSDLLLRW
jgi:hypothetical protein